MVKLSMTHLESKILNIQLKVNITDVALKLVTPTIQWVGGKKRLLPKIISKLPKTYKKYHELFLGGGALLFKLLPDVVESYEINSRLVDLYNIIKLRPHDLIRELQTVETEYNALTREERKIYYLNLRDKFNSLTIVLKSIFLEIWFSISKKKKKNV